MKLWIAALLLMPAPAMAFTIPAIEPVHGMVAGRDAVTVTLGFAACTKKSDLTVAVGNTPPRPLLLIARKRPPACVDAGRVEIIYSLEELGLKPGQPFNLANPLVGEPPP